ncbi:hypothetical protein [Rhodopirellula bahusiensis]|uniref:hypothetical protein n=1 Tax=Rhodopirellula bahusiensis TaxID=2014065 RepID=UPI00130479B0|nr:hypothetical protein [Rhodopirellula bahusiensis]
MNDEISLYLKNRLSTITGTVGYLWSGVDVDGLVSPKLRTDIGTRHFTFYAMI